MKKASVGLLAFIYSTLAAAGPDVIIPSKAVDHLFYLYKNYSIVSDEVSVVGQSFTRTGPNSLSHDETGHQSKISLDRFVFYRYLGASVFRARSGSGTASGTASLIGKNLVLTNQHVLATDNKKKQCGKFEVYLDDEEKVASTCKQVLYCDVQDFCVAEMNPVKGKNLSDIVRPISLKTTQETKSKQLFIVGNALGLGIQGSSGKEYKYVKKGDVAYGHLFDENVLIHHTPTLSGSSGSPVFNEQGIMVGLNYANNSRKGYVDDDANNLAVPSPYILSQLKKNIPSAVYNSILKDQSVSDSVIDEYKDQFQRVVDFTSNIKLDEAMLIKAIKTNSTAEVDKEISNQFEHLKSELTNFSDREQTYLMSMSTVPEINQINAVNISLSDWTLADKVTRECYSQKDLTLECRQDAVIKRLSSHQLMRSFSEQSQRSIVQARLKLPETTVFDILGIVKGDRSLVIKMFKKCLAGVNKISNSTGTIFYGNSSSLYFGNTACHNIIVDEIRNSGVKWTADLGGNEKIANMVGSNTDLSKFEETFEQAVGSKWMYGLLGKSGTKAEKVQANKDLVQEWLSLCSITEDKDDWFGIINPKMSKSIF